LGAASAAALDIDPGAIEATAANAAANGVADRIVASTEALATFAGTFDVVVANIGVRVLGTLAADLVARVAPGGLLVLSGLLADQLDAVVAVCAGCVEVERRDEDGWSVGLLRRP
jgi:ribosomal protein L11 methyltransferase